MKSTYLSLSQQDWIKGLILAMLGAVIGAVGHTAEVWITTSTFAIDKATLIVATKAAIAAGVTYIIHNFFSDTTKAAQNRIIAEAKKEGVKPTLEPAATIDQIEASKP